MTTLMQAATRAREEEHFPPDGGFGVRQLQQHFQPPPQRGSLRALIAAMRTRTAVGRPFAVILCRFKGDGIHPDEGRWKTFFQEAFTPGTGGLVDYWRDASLGKIDVAGTRVFGWMEVDMTRAEAGFPPTQRGDLTAAAIRAVQSKQGDPITGFYNQISIYMYRQTVAGLTIDGSTDGITGRINLTAPFDGEVTAHEMGHSLGMSHDGDVTGDTQYRDACCIMSQSGPFTHQRWGVTFGPAVCLPHLLLQGWMYTRRMLVDDGAWAALPNGMTLQLAPNSEPAARAFLGASLAIPQSSPAWSYLLEVVTGSEWNRGIPGMPYVMVRRISSQTDLSPLVTNVYLNKIHVDPSGSTTSYQDPSANTTFTVSLASARGPVVTVHAKKN